ncbi:hypothetical protein [Oceanobacillus sp. AG]|uniref:hypothetical protein n=1 Tax=Oceanobacillus sp. AG TaxID=2681969 RepID=UPI0012EC52A9|nr:hypothetical protein [Oceanobacillus sp. AG]
MSIRHFNFLARMAQMVHMVQSDGCNPVRETGPLGIITRFVELIDCNKAFLYKKRPPFLNDDRVSFYCIIHTFTNTIISI